MAKTRFHSNSFQMDSFSMFSDRTPGEESVLSGVITLLAVAKAIGNKRAIFEAAAQKRNKYLLFALLHGVSQFSCYFKYTIFWALLRYFVSCLTICSINQIVHRWIKSAKTYFINVMGRKIEMNPSYVIGFFEPESKFQYKNWITWPNFAN